MGGEKKLNDEIGKGKTKTGKRKGKNPPKMEEEKIPKKGQR